MKTQQAEAERIYTLPDEFFGGMSDDARIYFYQATQSSQKNKVCFRQHLLCFLLEGHKEVFAGPSRVAFDHNSILLMPAGNTLMSERTTRYRTYKSILLFFPDSFLASLLTDGNLKPRKDTTDQDLFLFPKDPYLRNFEQSLQLLEKVITSDAKLVKTKLEEILLYLLAKDPRAIQGFVQKTMQRNRDMHLMQVIQKQTDPNLTNEELAFLCNMSVSSFKRRFTAAFKTTPGQYFIAQKMEMAATLLRQDRRPADIYYELGYETQSAFSNEFKKHFGVSPKAFKPS